jgi:hypothetical protein
MSERLSSSSTKYGPSVFSGVRMQEAAAAASGAAAPAGAAELQRPAADDERGAGEPGGSEGLAAGEQVGAVFGLHLRGLLG